MIATVYVHAKSKVDVNRRIITGEQITGMTNEMVNVPDISKMPDGTVIKFWSIRDGDGIQIVKSYGQIKNGKVV
jgi:ribosomal protein L2